MNIRDPQISGGWRDTPAAPLPPASQLPQLPILLVVGVAIIAVAYNGLLAIASASGASIGMTHVIGAEFMLLLAAASLIVVTGRTPFDAPPMLLIAFFGTSALLVSMFGQAPYPEMLRNAAIIVIFFMLGVRSSWKTIRICFGAAALIVGGVLLFEAVSTASYVSTFQPARYYELTRGSEPLETVDGLYRNASGFESRFLIAEIIGHRASSIFLEPVSLGNFGVVLLGFVTSGWSRMSVAERVGYLLLVGFILLTTNSRILLGFVMLCPLIFLIGPRIGQAPRLLILPAVLLAAFLVYAFGPGNGGDNLIGRTEKAVRNMGELGASGLFGFRPELASEFSDSGYAFVIGSSSVLGLGAIWLYSALIVPSHSPMQGRAGLFLPLYVSLNLLVSGTSVFSVKAAALLWLFIGYVRAAEANRAAEPGAVHQEGGWKQDASSRKELRPA